MSEENRIEEWLKRTSETPEMQDLLAKAEKLAIPEDVLAEYYAGTLSPEDERQLQRRAALSEPASAFLANLDADVQAAAADVSPKLPALLLLRERLRRFARDAVRSMDAVRRPTGAWRVAASVAALVLMVVAGQRVLDRPPSQFGRPFDPTVVQRGPRTLELPGGTILDRVDPDWQLREPDRYPDRVRWFAWDPVLGAASYELQLLDDSGSVLYIRNNIAHTYARLPWKIQRQLTVNTTYTWVVTALDANSTILVRSVGRFQKN